MAEKIIVLGIVALAVFYIGYKFLAKKNRGKCSCGCDGCDGVKNWDSAGCDSREAPGTTDK